MTEDVTAYVAATQISIAWGNAVEYRKILAKQEIVRPHLEDMDLFGVLMEMSEDGHLVGEPLEVMARVIREDRRLALPAYISDPAQEIYDASVDLLNDMHVLNDKWRTDTA